MSKIFTFLTTHLLGDVNFQVFGKKPDSDTGNEKDDDPSPAYLPSAFESGLWTSNVVDLVNPSTVSPATGRQRKKRQSYAHYSGEMYEKLKKQKLESMQLKMATRKPENIFQRIFQT